VRMTEHQFGRESSTSDALPSRILLTELSSVARIEESSSDTSSKLVLYCFMAKLKSSSTTSTRSLVLKKCFARTHALDSSMAFPTSTLVHFF